MQLQLPLVQGVSQLVTIFSQPEVPISAKGMAVQQFRVLHQRPRVCFHLRCESWHLQTCMQLPMVL